MLVKKKNPEWYPSEKKDLKVGEVVEITDPEYLIKTEQVVAVDEDGRELSAYDLYGVLTKDERTEFEEFKKMKEQEALKKKFEAEAEALKAEKAKLDATKKAEDDSKKK